MTEEEWLVEYKEAFVDLRDLAETATNVKPHNGLALRAINYLNTLLAFEEYLNELGYEWG